MATRAAAAAHAARTSKMAHLTASVREVWTAARVADRHVMELRTHLSRHSG